MYGLRLNPARGSITALKDRSSPGKPARFLGARKDCGLQEDAALSKHPYHTTGVFYIQDPSAMAAAVLLDPKPGEWILDIAAAPGGKATHIAARMLGQGVFVANDTVRRRTSVLAKNLERMGITNALITNETPERLASRWRGLFDAVMVDAPCSGEGMFSRDPRAVQDWSLHTVAHYAQIQKDMLDDVAPLVRPGGRILYGTCTFSPEENEGVIDAFLKSHQDFQIIAMPAIARIYTRVNHSGSMQQNALKLAGRFWPHKGPGHGHFYALLQRTGTLPPDLPERWKQMDVPGRVYKLYEQAMTDILVAKPSDAGLLLTSEDDLYITPMDPKLWSDLRVLRPGLWVASLRHNKIMPDHALAMTLKPEDVQRHVQLSVDDPRLHNYLDGSVWIDDG